ncbi:hypothetical protein LTS10_010592 [Elasticomyces elasticus]|nr:hypothetical protein LTS10_010592 [Elasticomyces elasticus]
MSYYAESFSGPITRQVNDAVTIPNEMTFEELRNLLASRQIAHFETEIGAGPINCYQWIGMYAHGKLIHIIDDLCWDAVKASCAMIRYFNSSLPWCLEER